MKKLFSLSSITLLLLSFLFGQAFAKDTPLSAALDAQPENVKARYAYRHPQETLEFFGIQPGMTVVEALPGGGWYSKILLPFLGSEGKLIGTDYSVDMWSKFDSMSPEKLAAKKDWVATWTKEASQWRGDNDASIAAFQYGSLPADMRGTADAVLFIRAMHGLARFEDQGGYLASAISDSMKVLKPGGIVGVVQHEARADRPDEWADGSNGYLKKQYLIDQFKKVGFELVGESDINQNEKDQAKEGDFVWRLPPSYATSKDDAEKKAAMAAIGESNRMTLKFRKPK